MRKIINKKLNSKKILGLTTLVLSTALLTSCNISFPKKAYENTKIECDSYGTYYETKQFGSYSPEENKEVTNSFLYYGEWEQIGDNEYSRLVQEYDIKDKTYEDIKVLIDNKNIDIEETLGRPSYEYIETISDVNENELEEGNYFKATIYKENKDKYVIVRNANNIPTILFMTGVGAVFLLTGGLIGWSKYEDIKLEKSLKKKREN